MRRNEGLSFLDFDMYSNRISFFSNNREKIGSYFGVFLTAIYLMISSVLIIMYSLDAVQRTQVRVYDSTMSSEEAPYININSQLINFAFGLENRISSNRYIDPSIYYPEVLFLERVKIEGGSFMTVNRQELNYSRCSRKHFGQKYSNLLQENDLNDSYCLDDFNLTLAGGYKYNKMNYIRIKIVPCINNTKNNFTCKPKNIIEEYLTGTYFSILFKDIGLNPSNYLNPILPTLQDLYTTVDKQIFKDFILNFRLIEIHTDTGLFHEKIQKQKFLQFIDDKQSFYFRSEEEFNSGKQLCVVQIRLDDIIHVQNRSYKKLPESFSIIGGYLQILSTIFTFISIIISKLNLEVKIMNDLFNCDFKGNKITIKIRTLKDFASLKNKDYMKRNYSKKLFFYRKFRSNKIDISFNNSFSKQLLIGKNNNPSLPSLNKVSNKKIYNTFDHNNKNNNDITIINPKIFDNNFYKNKIYLHPLRCNNNIIDKNNDNTKDNKNSNNNIINNSTDILKVNIMDYYCFAKCCKKSQKIELFELGINLYRKRMDIINVFTILLLTEKLMLQFERQNYLGLNKDNEICPSIIKVSQKKIEL